jgi:hypothetical protein
MSRHIATIYLPVFLLLMMSLSACASSATFAPTDKGLEQAYEPSKTQVDVVLQNMGDTGLTSLRGKARVAFSSPGNSDRGIAEFTADRKHMMAKVRNSLGIEGAHIVVDSDSVLLYYIIDKIAWKLSINDYQTRPEIRLRLPLNLLDMLKPMIESEKVLSIEENNRYYKVNLHDSSQVYLDRSSLLPHAIRYQSDLDDRFTDFTYDSYAELNGVSLPRRIQAVTADRKNRIRFDITELELNPENAVLMMSIPASVPIYRFKNEF